MLEATPIVNAVSGFLIAGVALWVGIKGKFRGRYLAFALAEGAFGLAVGLDNARFVLGFTDPAVGDAASVGNLVYEWLRAGIIMVSIAGLVALLLRHPDPVSRGFSISARTLWPLFAIVAAYAIMSIGMLATYWQFPELHLFWRVLPGTSFNFLVAAQLGVVATLAFIYARISPQNAQARQETALFAVAMSIYPVTRMGLIWATIAGSPQQGFPPEVWSLIQPYLLGPIAFSVGLIVALWFRAGVATGQRAPMAVVLLFAALIVVGVFVNYDGRFRNVLPGVSRVVMFMVLGYAIVRHQYLGIDVKVRWGLSKSTMAAAFIAVFFVGSEAAQVFLGDRLGGEYFGIGAAGLLVFAIAPLQRFADRIAQQAVPDATGGGGKLDVYRETVMRFLGDGELSIDEEVHLATLAQELGIAPAEAVRIRHEVPN